MDVIRIMSLVMLRELSTQARGQVTALAVVSPTGRTFYQLHDDRQGQVVRNSRLPSRPLPPTTCEHTVYPCSSDVAGWGHAFWYGAKAYRTCLEMAKKDSSFDQLV